MLPHIITQLSHVTAHYHTVIACYRISGPCRQGSGALGCFWGLSEIFGGRDEAWLSTT